MTEDQDSLENQIKLVYIQIRFSVGRIVSRVWFQIRNYSRQFYSKLFIFSYYFLFQKQSCNAPPSKYPKKVHLIGYWFFFSLNPTEEDTNDNILCFSTGNRNLFFSFKTHKINPVTMSLHIYIYIFITASYLSAGRLLQIRSLTDFWCL